MNALIRDVTTSLVMCSLLAALLGCSSTATLTFNYEGTTYVSPAPAFSKVEGGYHVRNAASVSSAKTIGAYTEVPTISNVFVPDSKGRLDKTTHFDMDSPWLFIPLGIGLVIYLVYALGK